MGVWDCIDRNYGDGCEYVSLGIVDDCKRGLAAINAWLPQPGIEDTALSRILTTSRLESLVAKAEPLERTSPVDRVVALEGIRLA